MKKNKPKKIQTIVNTFIRFYWNNILERDLNDIFEYIDLREDNYNTSSQKNIALLINIGLHFECVCKALNGTETGCKTIIKYKDVIDLKLDKRREIKIIKEECKA